MMTDTMDTSIDWGRVARICEKSFAGGRLTDEEQDYVKKAYNADPETYSATSSRVKSMIRQEIRKGERLP